MDYFGFLRRRSITFDGDELRYLSSLILEDISYWRDQTKDCSTGVCDRFAKEAQELYDRLFPNDDIWGGEADEK